jgi:hypothetical protein
MSKSRKLAAILVADVVGYSWLAGRPRSPVVQLHALIAALCIGGGAIQ